MCSCETKTGVCEVPQGAAAPMSEPKCACGGMCGGDPIVCAMLMWKAAFHEAKKAVMVDILKAKIKKAWGTKMEKMADAVLDAMEAKKESMMALGKAKADLRAKFEDILKKG